jgi:hypothetical protein
MEQKGSSLCLQDRFTCHCSEPDETSPHVNTLFLKSISILFFHIPQGIVSSIVSAGKKPKIRGNV